MTSKIRASAIVLALVVSTHACGSRVSDVSNDAGYKPDSGTAEGDAYPVDASKTASDRDGSVDPDASFDDAPSCPTDCTGQPCLGATACGNVACTDACVQMAVLFGGSNASGVLGDTWGWDGTAWTQPPNSGGPPARTGTPLLQMYSYQAIMMGGAGASGELTDVWVWYGASWTKQGDETSPSAPFTPRDHAATVEYDGGTLVFGGKNATTGTIYGDSWLTNGNSGSLESLAWATPGPSARYGAAAGSLPTGKVVLFGGATSTGDVADTWIFFSGWISVAAAGPSARHGAAMASLGSSLVLFGGTNGASDFGDTWIFDGSAWTQVMTSGPSPRSGAAMTSLGGSVVLFGGVAGTGNTYLGDTWVFDGKTWTQKSVTGPSARADAAFGPSEPLSVGQ